MVQLAQEDPSSTPQYAGKKLGPVAYTCNLSADQR